jgi:two-component system phosphate regulon sensor histidine kinase PhoR
MTHEFKTPIATIAVSAEVLKDPNIVRQPERLINYAGIIEKENMRLKQQVERVLQMARLDKATIGLKKENISLHMVITEAIRHHTMALEERNGIISSEFNAMPDIVHADRFHLAGVFNNLIDNAIKYCKEIPRIQILTFNNTNGISIEVVDNGIGIRPENHKKIFQKFYRVPTGNVHDVKGFGLGLSYTKTIVEAHGGQISLESNSEKGSSFKIFIPA